MPIKKENRDRYPKDWKAISKRIRRRARNRCECRGECGLRHVRVDGKQRDVPAEADESMMRSFRCSAVNGKQHPVTGSKVVLTVGHRNHRPEDNADENLAAWCQRCHLRHDRDHHQANARRTRDRKTGQGALFA